MPQPAAALSLRHRLSRQPRFRLLTARCAARIPCWWWIPDPRNPCWRRRLDPWHAAPAVAPACRARRRHIQRMSSPVNVHFDRIDIQPGHQLLEVGEHVGGDLARSNFVQQVTAILFPHGSVAGDDVELLLVARLLLNNPIGDHEIGKCIARAPSVVAMIE